MTGHPALTYRQWKSLEQARRWRDAGVSGRRKVDRRWIAMVSRVEAMLDETEKRGSNLAKMAESAGKMAESMRKRLK